MGNVSDRQIQVVQDPRIYFQTDLPKFIYEERIGNGKFMKSYLMKIDDTAVAVKVYLKPADDDVDRYAVVLTRLWQTLSPSRHPYLLPYQMWIKSSTRVARPQTTPHFLIRQYFPFNLYDRLSTRPFLSNMEKLWLIYQLMRAVEECHKEGIRHGDIKPENVMVTSWNWVVLTDFAPYKPVFIPNDDPTDFHYFFDSMGRRRCSLAPERFISRQKSAVDATCDAERSLLPAMDTFSLGCTIAEVLLDGEPLLDLPTMLRYKAACEDPSGASQMTSLADADSPALQTINRIRDHRMRQAIVMMTSHSPAERESVHSCRSRLEECQVFPAYFNGTLYDFFLQLHAKGTTPDDKIGIICKNYGALMEHIAGCVDEEGARFFDRALCRVYNRAEGTDEDRTSQDLDDNARSDPMETYVDLAAARYRRSNVTGEASVKALKSKVVKFSSGRSVASCLEEAVQQQSDTNTTDVGKSTGGGSSLLAKALQTADEKSGSSSLATKSIDDRAMVELIDQFEKLIDDARRSSQLSADDVQATPTTPAPASSSFKNSAGRTTGSGDDKQHGEVSPAERTDREGNTKSQLQSFSSLVFALRGDGSKLFDVDETPSGGSITHYQPSSLSPYVESVSEIREEVQGRLHKRHSEEMSGGLLLVIQIICSTIRYLRHPQSRVTSLMLLSRLGSLCNDIVILERIVPFVMLAIEDPVAVVRATALRCLRSLLNAVTEISEVNSNIFKEFIFPALDNVVAKDTEAIVRIAFAESIGKFAETSMRFLDVARFMHQNKCISAVTGEGGITADGDSAVQVLVEGSYDAQAAALHQHVSKWIRDLVLDGNIGMSMDSKNDAKRQMPSGSHSSIVKRAILEDVVRLCVFFGKQEKIMDLFAQLLAYVNHQDWDLDWELRNAFCIKIPLVCAFLGPAVTSECILPFLEKARVDVHEMVVASAVRCIWTLVEMQLLARPLVVDVVSKTVPLLLHPSAAIRNNAIGMIEAAAKLFGVTDSYVFLLPYVRPILQCDLIGFEITRKSLMESLVRPIQRSAYQRAVREWPQSMGGGAAGGIGGEQTPSSGENRGRGDSVLSVDLEGKGIDGVDVSGVLVETDMAMSTVLDGNRLNDADGNELAKSIVSAGVEVIPPFKNSKSSAGFVDEDASKLQFLKEYIEMALKENPSRSSLWKGVSNTPSSRRSSSRRQSSSSFRSSAPMSLDSLLDVFSYQTLSTLSDHFVHSVFVPHEKYSLLHSVPDQLRIMTADPNIQPAIDLTWFKSMYGIDVDQSLEGGGRGGTTGYYETEQTQLSSTPTQPRPSAVMAGTPPPQYQQHSRRNMSRMSSAPDLLNGVGTDLGRALKSDEVSIGELHGIRRKIKALNIPPLSPDFGSLVQPTDGRPYSMFVESLDVTQAGDALSGQPWRPKENTVVSTLFEHTGAVNRIALSQDQSFFVSASSDGTAKVWQVKGVERNAFPRSAVTYSKHNGRLMDAAIIENSHSVATCSDNGAIHVWRVDLGGVGGKRAHSHYAPSGPPQMSSNSDLTPPSTRQSGSTSLAWGSSTIKILSHDEGPVLALQHFTGDVASVLTFISRRGLVHGWDLRCSQEAFLYSVRPELGYPTSMVCSPDRNWISVGTSQGYIGLWDIRYNVMCKLWRHSSGTPIHRLACAKSSPNVHSTREGVLASAEGAYMFVASGNNEAAVWAVPEGGECLKCFRSVSMTAARSALASLPQLHDIPIPSHPLAAFQGGSVQYMNRSPISTSLDNCAVRALVGRVSHTSASYLVTAGTDRSIRYWDFTSPTRCFTVSGLDAAQPKPVYETPPSPALRGKLFLCYDSAVPSVKATLQSQLPLREYRGTLPRVANYKDAILDLKTIDLPIRMMISASRDGEIKLWR